MYVCMCVCLYSHYNYIYYLMYIIYIVKTDKLLLLLLFYEKSDFFKMFINFVVVNHVPIIATKIDIIIIVS